MRGGTLRIRSGLFPERFLLATLIIVVTLVCGALVDSPFVLPQKQISLVAWDLCRLFRLFFENYHLAWLLPLVALTLVIGGMGSVSNWIIAPIRGLLLAAKDGYFVDVIDLGEEFAPVSVVGVVGCQGVGQAGIAVEGADQAGPGFGLHSRQGRVVHLIPGQAVEDGEERLVVFLQSLAHVRGR